MATKVNDGGAGIDVGDVVRCGPGPEMVVHAWAEDYRTGQRAYRCVYEVAGTWGAYGYRREFGSADFAGWQLTLVRKVRTDGL